MKYAQTLLVLGVLTLLLTLVFLIQAIRTGTETAAWAMDPGSGLPRVVALFSVSIFWLGLGILLSRRGR